MRKWDNVSRDDLLTAVAHIKHRYPPDIRGTALNLIEYFHERMEDDEHYDVEVLHLLMKHVFALIMEGKSADQAFGLKLIKGEDKKKDTFDRDIAIAAAFILNMRKEDATWDDARFDTAESFGVSESTVTRACEEFRDGLDLLPDDVLRQIDGT